MKIIKTLLVIILAVFITATLGFTSTINTEDKIYKNPIRQTLTSQDGSVDFMSGDDYLSSIPYITYPGDTVYFKLRVYNNTPDNGYCGGSTVRFTMNGRVIDEVPFLLNIGEEFKDVSTHIYLPEGEYSSLPENQRVTAQIQAIIDPYDKTPESNEDNNSATFQFIVKGVHQGILEGTNPGITVDVSGLSVWSVKNDAPNDKISAALPGQKLNLKARLRFTGDATSDDINVKFILNGIVIKDFKRQIGNRPASGYIDLRAEYYVPMNAAEPFDFTVILDNGSQARITIPLIRWDVGISPGDMYWTGETVAVPGKNIFLRAKIKNITLLKFPFDFNKIAYRVLIDGEVFYEDDLFLFNDTDFPAIPAYKVPANRTTPIHYTIVLDPYGQLDESIEANNTATITIPIQNTGSAGPDFSISAVDLSYISKPILPGSQIKLSAAILNNSKSLLSKDLRVHFKVNGSIIWNFTVSKGSLGPLKYCLVTKDWTVPQNLPAGSKFEVALDPADPDRDFPGENASDNTASIILDTNGPDLEVTADCLSWLPKEPQAGGSVTLYAGIRNTGLASTKTNCTAKFFIDGNSVAEPVVIPPIAGVSGYIASCYWSVPTAPELTPLEWYTLKGEPGKLPIPSGATKDYKFKVQVDTGNTVTETDEGNNIAEENLTVYVPYNKAVVYVRAFDVVGNISGAEVELKTSDGKTATTYSADNGWCTFTGVPYGSYTITISANKYIVKSITSEVKTNLVHYKEVELKRATKEHPYFSATASTLEGITALQVDFNCTIIDPRIIDSDFYFEWRADGNLISESKSFSHTFIKTGTHEVTFYIKNLNYDIVDFKSFNINVLPPEITLADGGKILNSSGNIFLDEDLTLQDADKDGINQAWEDAAMNAANPLIEFDEDEELLKEPSHKVVNFVRISPFTSNKNRKYILFTYGIVWSKDYGRYYILPHNGDVEKVVEAWEVIDNKHLILRWVYTSAHSNTDTNHSGVWKAVGKTSVDCKIKWWPDETLSATLEFVPINTNLSVLKVYASEDKHAIYPSEDCGEAARLWYVPLPLPGWFVMESVGSDGKYKEQLPCKNIGEEGEDARLIDDISDIFPNERIWSGNINKPTKFAGGLAVNDDCPGNIGGNLSGIPPMLEEVLNKQ